MIWKRFNTVHCINDKSKSYTHVFLWFSIFRFLSFQYSSFYTVLWLMRQNTEYRKALKEAHSACFHRPSNRQVITASYFQFLSLFLFYKRKKKKNLYCFWMQFIISKHKKLFSAHLQLSFFSLLRKKINFVFFFK